METYSSVLAWKFSWIEEPGWLQSKGPQSVGHGWVEWAYFNISTVIFNLSSVQLLSCVNDSWITAHQASLSITNSWSSLRLTSIESVMPSSHLILCHPFLLLPPIPPSIRVFSNESTLCMRWPKYWSFSFSISHSKEHPGLIAFRMDWLYGTTKDPK